LSLIIWGGESSEGILGDMYMFNISTNIWSLVESIDIIVPSPVKGACMASTNDGVLIFGGLGITGLHNELWMYDFGSARYTMLDLGDFKAPIKVWTNGCLYTEQLVDDQFKKFFYTVMGEASSSVPLGAIYRFNIVDSIWEIFLVIDEFARSNASIIVLDNIILISGGH
jgi:hypothetical protein